MLGYLPVNVNVRGAKMYSVLRLDSCIAIYIYMKHDSSFSKRSKKRF